MTHTCTNPAGEGGDRQRHFLQLDDVVELTGQSLPVEVLIWAILTGTRQCAAPTLDLSVNAYTPARQLLRTGSHPDRLIEVYRGTTLCFRVSLATAARLTVKDGQDGPPRFRRYKPSESLGVTSPVAPSEPRATAPSPATMHAACEAAATVQVPHPTNATGT